MAPSPRSNNTVAGFGPEHLFALVDGLVALVDQHGTILRLAPQWQPPGAAAPASLHALLSDADRVGLDDALATAVEQGRATFIATLAATGHTLAFAVGSDDQGRLIVTATPAAPDALTAQSVVRLAGVGLTLLDADGHYRYVNDAYCDIYGYRADELLGHHFTIVFPDDDHGTAMEHHRAVLQRDSEGRGRELWVRRRDGSPMLINTRSRRVDLPGGEVLRLATVIDITGIRAAERRLADTENRLGDITDSLPGAIYQIVRMPDGTFRTTYMSEGLGLLTGLPRDAELADFDTLLDLLPVHEARRHVELMNASARDMTRFEQEFPLDGPAGRRWIQSRSQPHPREDGAVVWNGLMIDITQRREAEEGLAEAEHRLRAITGSLPGAIYQFRHRVDGSYAFTYMSEGIRRICGFPDDYPIDDFETFLGLLPEPDRQDLLRAIRVSEQTLAPLYREFRLQTPAGTLWVEARSVPRPEPDGGIVCNGLLVDVTERRAAQSEAARLNAILESTPDCVAITDTQGDIVYLNAGGRALLELDAGATVNGRSFFDFVTPADREHILEHASHEAAHHGTWSGEATVVTAQGRCRRVSQTILCHRETTGRVSRFSTIIRDLSERMAVEEDLRASEERFRLLYHHTPTLMHSLDADGRLIAVSDYWLQHLGYPRDEVIGAYSRDFLTPASRERAWEINMPQMLARGTLRDEPMEIVRADGEILQVLLSATVEYDDAGEMTRSRTVMIDVTEQRRAEADYQDIFENATEGIYRSTADGRLLRANPALARLHGYDSEAELIERMGNIHTDWFVDPERRRQLAERLERDGRVTDFEAEIVRHRTGERIWTSENARVIRAADGSVRYFEGTVRDITGQRRAARLSERRSEILEMIARDHPLVEILHEVAGTIEQQYDGLTAAILRLQDGKLFTAAAPRLRPGCVQAIDGQPPEAIGSAIATALREIRAATDHALDADEADGLAAAAGAAGYRGVSAAPVRDQHGDVLGVVVALSAGEPAERADDTPLLTEMAQITSIAIEQYRLAQELVHQAQYDALTDLPNRALLGDRLAQGIKEAHRKGRQLGVLLLDLDEFKLVNDTLGHSAGDELLQHVAVRLRNSLRASDTVARLGGDEFVFVVPLHGGFDATEVARRVLETLQPSMCVAGREVTARPSIGISIYPQDGDSAEALMQAADTAMYAAKNAGKNRYRYFAETMNAQVSERLRLEADLRTALAEDQLELHFQPQIHLADRSLAGAEALLRWNHPERGLLGPGQFLPVAERGPLIGEIDRYVLRAAAGVLAEWQAGGEAIILAANISARELHSEGFGAEVGQVLAETGVDPNGLELEITESMLMEDFQHASRQLEDLKARAPGLRIAIDDFGSGYSSLNYLRHLPIDTLKVDRAFVTDVASPESADTARAIVRTIVELGRSLGLTVIAEGVETEDQADLLQALGCHTAQGFWFDRPLRRADFDRRLGSGR